MAKPKLWGNDGPSTSFHLLQSRQRLQQRRTINPSSHVIAGPSSGLLSILATIAHSSFVEGSPITSQPSIPAFLCPSIAQQAADCSPESFLLPTPVLPIRKRGQVPNKYEQGTDGRWRRADIYTLYGSTVCESCQATSTHITTSTTIASTTTLDPILDSLPNGWKPSSSPTVDHSPIILWVSLIVAISIMAFMVGCIFWRKRRRSRGWDKDMELELRNLADDEQSTRSKQRIWVKATSRWKANVRFAARRRRNARRLALGSTSSQLQVSTTPADLPGSPRASMDARPPRSRSSSRRNSLSTLRGSGNLSATSLDSIRDRSSESIADSPEPSPPIIPPYPPAYHRRVFGASRVSIIDTSHDPLPSSSQETFSSCSGHEPEQPLPYVASAAHIAIDDKTVLARMANLASAPPNTGVSIGESSSGAEVSAPVWQDEELEHFDEDEGSARPHLPNNPPQSNASSFPLPPSKGHLAPRDFYDYPYSFEDDIENIGPEAESSAPPFEENAPTDCVFATPSAPPLPEHDMVLSAPVWDDEVVHVDQQTDGDAQNHDRMAFSRQG